MRIEGTCDIAMVYSNNDWWTEYFHSLSGVTAIRTLLKATKPFYFVLGIIIRWPNIFHTISSDRKKLGESRVVIFRFYLEPYFRLNFGIFSLYPTVVLQHIAYGCIVTGIFNPKSLRNTQMFWFILTLPVYKLHTCIITIMMSDINIQAKCHQRSQSIFIFRLVDWSHFLPMITYSH